MRRLGVVTAIFVSLSACGARNGDDNRAMCNVFRAMRLKGPDPGAAVAHKAYHDLARLRPSDERLSGIRTTVLKNRAEFEPVHQFATAPGDYDDLVRICSQKGIELRPLGR